MIDKNQFESIRKEMKAFEAKRESVIIASRDAIRLSKLMIYSIHRKELKQAESLLKSMKAKIAQLPKDLYDAGIQKVAIQEYVEAATFFYFVRSGRIPSSKELKVKSEDYLLGLCDLTGELVRYAVNSVIDNRPDDAKKAKDLVSEIYHEFLKFDLRNGELRKKSDSIKWNLNKLEDMEYDSKVGTIRK